MGRTHAEARDRMRRIATDCLNGMDLDDVIRKYETGRTMVDKACKRYGIKVRMKEKVGRKTHHVFTAEKTIAEVADLLWRMVDEEDGIKFTRLDVKELLMLASRLQMKIDAAEQRISGRGITGQAKGKE